MNTQFFISPDFTHIAFDVSGAGSPILLLHGGGSSRPERHEELILNIGTGHGILYKPLDEWILPTVEWAEP